MFNPKGRIERDSEDWAIEALKDTRNGDLQYVVILGFLGSIVVVPFAGVPMGVFSFVCCMAYSFSKANASQHSQKAIQEFGCVAHALVGSRFQAFRAQVGDEEVISQCQWAKTNNYPLSKDAAEFLERQSHQLQAIAPELPMINTNHSPLQPHPPLINSITPAMTPEIHVPLIHRLRDQTQPSKKVVNSNELTQSIASDLKNTIIVGVPGVGKDLFLSNVLRDIRSFHPQATIFFIDPKADPKERGYFEGCVDYLYSLNIAEKSPDNVYSWVCECLEEFESFNAGTELKILCFGEVAATMKTLGTIKKAAQYVKAKFVSYSSSGDSRGIKFIASSQNAHTDGIGFNGGERSIFTPIVLISAAQIPASEQILKAQIIPSDKRLSSYELEALCRKSPVNRAIYHGGLNNWFPMPELPNHSGYDRDKRSFVNQDAALLAKLEASQENTITSFVANELRLEGEKAETMIALIEKTLNECLRPSLIKKFNVGKI